MNESLLTQLKREEKLLADEIARLESELQILRLRRKGLRDFMGIKTDPDVVCVDKRKRMHPGSTAAIAAAVLSESGRPMSPKEIAGQMAQRGYQQNNRKVATILGASHRFKRVSHGLYVFSGSNGQALEVEG